MSPGFLTLVRRLGWVLVWAGVYLLGFVAYELWGTNLLADRSQDRLNQQLVESLPAQREQVEQRFYDASTGRILAEQPTGQVETKPIQWEPTPAEAHGFGKIRIPKIGLDAVIVEGVQRDTLKLGPGHMSSTPMPGQPGNSVLSGHRTTYGAPFADLEELAVGDLIEVETATGVHTYQLREAPVVVKPTDIWVTDPREGAWLTLTTCHPKFSARQRLVVFAELVSGPNAASILES